MAWSHLSPFVMEENGKNNSCKQKEKKSFTDVAATWAKQMITSKKQNLFSPHGMYLENNKNL